MADEETKDQSAEAAPSEEPVKEAAPEAAAEVAKVEEEAAPVEPKATAKEPKATAKESKATAKESKEEAPAEASAAKPAGTEEKPSGEEKAAEGGDKAKEGRPQSKVDEVFMALEGGDAAKPKVVKAKGSKNVHTGIVHVQATFNNTIVTVTDANGNVIGWSTSGKLGFRGSRKSTAYAAQLVSQDACRQAMSHGLRQAEVRVKGPGSGRDSAVRAVQAIGIDVTLIKDVTPMPHNGCRPPKARRV
jgi:small subunit ribosomal protein S11